MVVIKKSTITINKNSALLLVDIQNDFCTGGALAVNESDIINNVIN